MTALPSIRSTSRGAILTELLTGIGTNHQALAAATGLDEPELRHTLGALEREGWVSTRGGAIVLSPRAGVVCGADLGATNCRVVAADLLGRPLTVLHHATPRDLDTMALSSWLARQLTAVAEAAHGGPLLAAAVGVPGPVSDDGTTVMGGHNLAQISGTGFVQELARHLGAPVRVENDSCLALRGEQHGGALSATESAVLLGLGTGMGCAVSIGGTILAGGSGLLGEFGRLPLPGRPHRLRDLLSGAGLVAYARAQGVQVDSAEQLFAQPDRNPGLITEVHDALRFLVCLVALAYEPRTIVLTGGFSESFDARSLTALGEQAARDTGVHSTLVHSALGGSAGLLGAMTSALFSLDAALGIESARRASDPAHRELLLQQLNTRTVDARKEAQ